MLSFEHKFFTKYLIFFNLPNLHPLKVFTEYLLQLDHPTFTLLQQLSLMPNYLIRLAQKVLRLLYINGTLIELILKVISPLFLLIKSQFMFVYFAL